MCSCLNTQHLYGLTNIFDQQLIFSTQIHIGFLISLRVISKMQPSLLGTFRSICDQNSQSFYWLKYSQPVLPNSRYVPVNLFRAHFHTFEIKCLLLHSHFSTNVTVSEILFAARVHSNYLFQFEVILGIFLIA